MFPFAAKQFGTPMGTSPDMYLILRTKLKYTTLKIRLANSELDQNRKRRGTSNVTICIKRPVAKCKALSFTMRHVSHHFWQSIDYQQYNNEMHHWLIAVKVAMYIYFHTESDRYNQDPIFGRREP
jgi:hypothetical protein